MSHLVSKQLEIVLTASYMIVITSAEIVSCSCEQYCMMYSRTKYSSIVTEPADMHSSVFIRKSALFGTSICQSCLCLFRFGGTEKVGEIPFGLLHRLHLHSLLQPFPEERHRHVVIIDPYFDVVLMQCSLSSLSFFPHVHNVLHVEGTDLESNRLPIVLFLSETTSAS